MAADSEVYDPFTNSELNEFGVAADIEFRHQVVPVPFDDFWG